MKEIINSLCLKNKSIGQCFGDPSQLDPNVIIRACARCLAGGNHRLAERLRITAREEHTLDKMKTYIDILTNNGGGE